MLNRHLVVPVLLEGQEVVTGSDEALTELSVDLGRSVPHLGLLGSAGVILAMRAPSEQMLNWSAVPPPYERLRSHWPKGGAGARGAGAAPDPGVPGEGREDSESAQGRERGKQGEGDVDHQRRK